MTLAATWYDVAVIGAGPAGAATARWLADQGCRVLLVERSRFDAPRVGESLAPGVQPLLRDLGVWDRFVALGSVPSWGTRSVWGEAVPQEHSHLMSPYGCGWHVDRARFDGMLAEAAVEAGATLTLGATLASCREEGARWHLVLNEGERTRAVTAQVLVDGTGRGARVAQWLGARRDVFDGLVGMTGWFGEIDTAAHGFTLVEAEADGWWYSSPVGRDRLVAMLMTDADLAGRANLSELDAWKARLDAAPVTSARIASGAFAAGPRAFSAVSQRLRRRDRSARWLAVGDAALAVDPVSGSGVLRALRTAKAGAQTVLAMLDGDASAALAAYETERDGECASYLEERARYYAAEERWADALFWRRRASGRGEATSQ